MSIVNVYLIVTNLFPFNNVCASINTVKYLSSQIEVIVVVCEVLKESINTSLEELFSQKNYREPKNPDLGFSVVVQELCIVAQYCCISKMNESIHKHIVPIFVPHVVHEKLNVAQEYLIIISLIKGI